MSDNENGKGVSDEPCWGPPRQLRALDSPAEL